MSRLYLDDLEVERSSLLPAERVIDEKEEEEESLPLSLSLSLLFPAIIARASFCAPLCPWTLRMKASSSARHSIAPLLCPKAVATAENARMRWRTKDRRAGPEAALGLRGGQASLIQRVTSSASPCCPAARSRPHSSAQSTIIVASLCWYSSRRVSTAQRKRSAPSMSRPLAWTMADADRRWQW